jgi:hypothetical protein
MCHRKSPEYNTFDREYGMVPRESAGRQQCRRWKSCDHQGRLSCDKASFSVSFPQTPGKQQERVLAEGPTGLGPTGVPPFMPSLTHNASNTVSKILEHMSRFFQKMVSYRTTALTFLNLSCVCGFCLPTHTSISG